MPTRWKFGSGVSTQVGLESRRLIQGAKAKALVMTDPGVRGAGLLNSVLNSLAEVGLEYSIFADVEPNPRDRTVHAAAERFHDENADLFVAVGGGSVIDTAKGAAIVVTHGGPITAYAGWEKAPGPITPLVAIPTTAGTGSEVTFWAVITDSATHTKLAIGDPDLAPAVALVDPLLTRRLPPALTLATGLDALTHAIEAYTCRLANPISDALALQAIRLIASNLPQAVANGENLTSREGMLLAASLAGIAFNNADVAAVHCLSEALGSLYDAPHGLLNAILLAYVMAYQRPACEERYADVAQALGTEPRAEVAIGRIIELTRAFQLPELADLGVQSQDLPRIAKMAAANVSNPSNPRPMTEADYLEILERALAGLPPNYRGIKKSGGRPG